MTTASLTSRLARPEATRNADSGDTRLRKLPTSAREKFERLRRTELRARALIDGLLDEIQRVRERRDEAVRDLSIFDRRYRPEAEFDYEESPETGTRKRVPAQFPEREAILQRIERCKSELQHLTQEQAAGNVGFSTSDILDWLASQSPSVKFIAAPVPLVKPAKGDTLSDALNKNRQAQSAIRDELSAAENARCTIAEAKDRMRAAVANLAEKGRPDIGNLFHAGEIGWADTQLTAGGHGHHDTVVSTTVRDAFALTIWAHQEAIVERLAAEIDRAGNDTNALSREAQTARVAQCERALIDLQRQEEAIIERLEAEGIHVRRTCSDPLILLGIEFAQS
jgi:hypothetical protein